MHDHDAKGVTIEVADLKDLNITGENYISLF